MFWHTDWRVAPSGQIQILTAWKVLGRETDQAVNDSFKTFDFSSSSNYHTWAILDFHTYEAIRGRPPNSWSSILIIDLTFFSFHVGFPIGYGPRGMTVISYCDLQMCETGIRGRRDKRGSLGMRMTEEKRKSPFTPCCESVNNFSTFEKYPTIE